MMESWAKLALDMRRKKLANPKLEEWVVETVQGIENRLTWLSIDFVPVSQTPSLLKLYKVHRKL